MMPTSESDEARQFAHPLPNETLQSLLHRVLPSVQTRRATAYNRLQSALRQSSHPVSSSEPRPSTIPDYQSTDYAAVCANVTEDLKLTSETIMELRDVLLQPNCPYKGMQQLNSVIEWLDRLQDLEERKLVATVSLHALKRSGEEEKIGRYAKELNQVDGEINELLEEVREFYFEEDEAVG